jgi:hypothetical protein
VRDKEKMDADGIPVRLTRKYSDMIDGVDLSGSKVGDRLQLPAREASLLIAEGWATRCAERSVPLRAEKSRAPGNGRDQG